MMSGSIAAKYIALYLEGEVLDFKALSMKWISIAVSNGSVQS